MMIPFFRPTKPDLNALEEVIKRGDYVSGKDVDLFEKEVADYLGVKYAVAVNSGTDALVIALECIHPPKGSEIITTPFTFWATTEAILRVGAKPVFADITDDFNIDVEQVKELMGGNTWAVLPVHLFGKPASFATLSIGDFVVDDCCQAFGAKFDYDAELRCYSFFPTKTLGGYGDGGLIATNNKHYAEDCKWRRNHGFVSKHYPLFPGYNSRLDSIQAAFLRKKLRTINKDIQERKDIAAFYDFNLTSKIGKPDLKEGVFNYYTIRAKNRRTLINHLIFSGIETKIFYPRLTCDNVHTPWDLEKVPNAVKATQEALSLPMYPGLSMQELYQICDAVNYFYEKGGKK